ncbi:hypothetical protein DW839_03555 [Enterocloster bolteae]|uniref:Uncharacterized protein n=1 Tax=Enterocloster bolteae TaxID=208479 RepID=A0A414AZD2_9FIRM|nr:hypothetical protein DW839_03555 [Enterocloster bolteae]
MIFIPFWYGAAVMMYHTIIRREEIFYFYKKCVSLYRGLNRGLTNWRMLCIIVDCYNSCIIQ